MKHVSNFVMSLFICVQEIMRDCVLEKGITFNKSYKEQKGLLKIFPILQILNKLLKKNTPYIWGIDY